MLKEFKEFAMKGNLVDMAVGFVMGGAFATVVTAFIQGVFLPILAPVMGGIDLSALTSFIIVAVVMFLIIKGMNSMQKKEEEAAPAAPPRQEVLLEEIRKLLAKQS